MTDNEMQNTSELQLHINEPNISSNSDQATRTAEQNLNAHEVETVVKKGRKRTRNQKITAQQKRANGEAIVIKKLRTLVIKKLIMKLNHN